jgi:hypothetical protein
MNKFTNIKTEGTESDTTSITGKGRVQAFDKFDPPPQQVDNDRNMDRRGSFQKGLIELEAAGGSIDDEDYGKADKFMSDNDKQIEHMKLMFKD